MQFYCQLGCRNIYISQSYVPRKSDGIPPILLPSSDTNKCIHERFVASCEGTYVSMLKISSSEEAWLKCVPFI